MVLRCEMNSMKKYKIAQILAVISLVGAIHFWVSLRFYNYGLEIGSLTLFLGLLCGIVAIILNRRNRLVHMFTDSFLRCDIHFGYTHPFLRGTNIRGTNII